MEVEASLLARRLQNWGAHCTIAGNAARTDALLRERNWDVVLADFALVEDLVGNAHFTGLEHMRRIVLIAPSERHELASLKGRGFTGYLVKPVRAASLAARFAAEDAFEPADLATPLAADDHAAPAKSLSILVAEDNEINALLTRALLTRLGHRPTVAGNGEAALQSWSAARGAGTPYDLVLMDVQMPGMDGLEAARRIRAAEAAAEDKPVRMLALTANPAEEAACLAAGMDGLLVKPLDRERLAAALAQSSTAALAA